MNMQEKMSKMLDELNDEVANFRANLHVAKLEVLEGWDKVEEVFEELKEEKDEARVKMHLLKLQALEGLDNLTEKFENAVPSKEDVRVRMHLAKLGVLEEWDALEEKMGSLKAQLASVKDSGEEAWEKLATAAKEQLDNLKKKFQG